MDDYLKRVVDTGVFPKTDSIGTLIASIKSDAEAIEMAFKAEVDTMKFFSDAMRNTNHASGIWIAAIYKEVLEAFRDERLRA